MSNFASMNIHILAGHLASVDTHAVDTASGVDYAESQTVGIEEAPAVIGSQVERCRAITNHVTITVSTRYPLSQEMQGELIGAASRGQVGVFVHYHNTTHG